MGCRIYPTFSVFSSCFSLIFDLNHIQFPMILCQKHHETARFLCVFLMTHRESLQMRALYSCCMADYPFLHPAPYHTQQGAIVRKNGAVGVG